MNIQIIKGRLTFDPEMNQTQSGVSVTKFTVAVNRNYSAKGEEKQTDFFNCVAWRSTAEVVSKYFEKGSEIIVKGYMQSRKYKDKNGNDRTGWELMVDSIEFCGSKSNKTETPIHSKSVDIDCDNNDDIPF